MMTLDEAIIYYDLESRKTGNGSNYLDANNMPETAERYRERSKEYKQLANWLQELKELRGDSDDNN